MRNYHMRTRGWGDIAQHVSIGKNGEVVLGRSITLRPISASYHNGTSAWHPFMFETIGNFDVGHDKLQGVQLASVLAILNYFHVGLGKPIKFHREMSSKTCPGSGVDKAKITAQAKAYKAGSTGHDVAVSKPVPQPTVPVLSNSQSITDYLNATGQDSSFANRTKLAQKHGITNYKGTAAQNLQLLAILRTEEGKNKKKSNATIAQEVIDGKWGVNPNRKRDLESAGYNYSTIQAEVNKLTTKPTPKPQAPKVVENIAIDGVWGEGTTRALQRALGTPVDGKISGQYKNATTNAISGVLFGRGGSAMVKALQRKLRVTADGYLGPQTIRALQRYLGTHQDGVISRPSSTMVVALQRRLRAGTF